MYFSVVYRLHRYRRRGGIKQGLDAEKSYLQAKCVNISTTVEDAVKVTINH